jgi:hypothetical protein
MTTNLKTDAHLIEIKYDTILNRGRIAGSCWQAACACGWRGGRLPFRVQAEDEATSHLNATAPTMPKFRVKALCHAKHSNKEITRVFDAQNEDEAREKMRRRFSVITFLWIKKVSADAKNS